MVISTENSARYNPIAFSLSDHDSGQFQSVYVVIGGIEYPGEVIVAEKWQSQFGERLTGTSMFRLVLLKSPLVPPSSELTDSRICVAVQGGAPERLSRVAESPSHYEVESHHESTSRSIENELTALREIRSNYATAADPGLNRLSAALLDHEVKINHSLADESATLWKAGKIVRAQESHETELSSEQVFLLEQPESWVEVVAAAVLGEPLVGASSGAIQRIFSDFQSLRLRTGIDALRSLCGLRLHEPTPIDRLASEIEGHGGSISGHSLIQLLVQDSSYPPAVALLWAIAYALSNDSELEFRSEAVDQTFLTRANISEGSFKELRLEHLVRLASQKTRTWDSELPFLQLVVPHANSTRFGGGRDSDVSEFSAQLSSVRDRVATVSPVLQSLEVAAGATERPLTSGHQKLLSVLGADHWTDFAALARMEYQTVAGLRAALSEAAVHWSAFAFVAEIESTIYYLDQVEFGRIDHALAIEHHMLRSRFNIETVVRSESAWVSLRDEFERWRQDYRRAYIEDHTQKQAHNLELQRRASSTTTKIQQIQRLERIDAIRTGEIDDLGKIWDESIRSLEICESDGVDIRLIDDPVCTNCRGRLGQPPNHTDVTDIISEVDQLFDGYRDRLASLVSHLVLESPSEDKLTRLFRLNSAGDLSNLANVLDDKVITFINELLGNSDGSTDGWTSQNF